MKFFMFLIVFISLIVFSCDKNPMELENNTIVVDVWKTDIQVDRETTLKYPENIYIPNPSRMYGYNVRAGYIKSISYMSSSSDSEKEFSIKLSDEIGNSVEFNSKTGLSEKHNVNLNMINFYKVEIIRPNETCGTVFLTVYVTIIPN